MRLCERDVGSVPKCDSSLFVCVCVNYFAFMYIFICVCLCVFMYVCVYVCMYVCMCVCASCWVGAWAGGGGMIPTTACVPTQEVKDDTGVDPKDEAEFTKLYAKILEDLEESKRALEQQSGGSADD
jgi:hypothetical protein